MASCEVSGGSRRMFIPKDPSKTVGDCIPIETWKIKSPNTDVYWELVTSSIHWQYCVTKPPALF